MKKDIMKTKSQQAIEATEAGNIKLACQIASGFIRELSKEDCRILSINFECSDERSKSFYESIGIDTEKIKERALRILLTYAEIHKSKK